MSARRADCVRCSAGWFRPAWLVACCALAICGCAGWQAPRLDPTGEHIFLPPGSPMPPFPPGASPVAPPLGPNTGLSLSPAQVIAPVGSEVVMIASVSGGEGYLLTNERVEWTLAPGGVGQFLSPGERRPFDVINWMRGLPRKLDAQYAVNSTLFLPQTLDRGTPSPYDDILIQGGQAWVSVTSPTEGTSRVTAFVPSVAGWDRRQQTASIYWIDAQWRFPPPAISPAGSRNGLTTMLTRLSDNSPLGGWRVRYEIAGGPEAGFAPGGEKSVEIITSDTGQATAEIVQGQPIAGTNQINIQVIRPPGPAGQNQALTIGAGSTLQTWASAAQPGTTIEPQPAPIAATPALTPPQAPALAPAAAARAELDVTVGGATAAAVGDNVQFHVQVTNRGTGPATKLLVTDRFDVGLSHVAATSPIEHDLVDLQPGASARLTLNFRVTQAGELCQDIEITGADGLKTGTRHCLTATAPPIAQPAPGEQRWEPEVPGVQPTPAEPPTQTPAEQPAPQQPPATAPRSAGSVTLSLRTSGASRRSMGETVQFTIEVANRGQKPVEDVVISDNFETSFEPARATEGNEWLEGGAIGWKVGTLEPGSTVRRDIEFKCLRETPRACNRVTVTAKELQPLAEEACVEVVGAGGAAAAPANQPRQPIRVTVAETTDPVRVGGKTTYQILVENTDSQSYFDVSVGATLSNELKLDSISSPVGTEGSIQPNAVRFTPVRELRAGEAPLSFELHTSGRGAGSARVNVEVTSRGQARPITAEQTTQVVP